MSSDGRSGCSQIWAAERSGECNEKVENEERNQSGTNSPLRLSIKSAISTFVKLE